MNMDDKNRALLVEGLEELGLPAGEEVVGKLTTYAGLLAKWNKVFNLTSVANPHEIITHHLLDSAALLPLLDHYAPGARTILDVGSGGGLPVIPMAIFHPDVKIHAVDAVSKKTAFLTQVGIELGLRNFRAMHKRVETIQSSYDVVTSRAFASLRNFTDWTQEALAQDGLWLAMKGEYPEAEIAGLDSAVAVLREVVPMRVPHLAEERHLVVMRKPSYEE